MPDAFAAVGIVEVLRSTLELACLSSIRKIKLPSSPEAQSSFKRCSWASIHFFFDVVLRFFHAEKLNFFVFTTVAARLSPRVVETNSTLQQHIIYKYKFHLYVNEQEKVANRKALILMNQINFNCLRFDHC